jgi:hypothetical protein
VSFSLNLPLIPFSRARYVITPSKCRSTSVVFDGETYSAQSKSTLYLKLYYGLCDDQSSTGGTHCVAWEDKSFWKDLDLLNKEIYDLSTNFVDDAQYTWPTAFRVGIACLVLIFVVVALLLYAIISGSNTTWEYQMGLVFVQFVLIVIIWLHLVLGLVTDMILPTSWKTYQMGCDIYTGPGAAWWAAVIAAVISIYSSVLLLFPYLMGPLWVNHMNRQTMVVTPSFDLNFPDDEIDEEDPYRGVEFQHSAPL